MTLTDPMRRYLGQSHGFAWDILHEFRRQFGLSATQAGWLLVRWLKETR